MMFIIKLIIFTTLTYFIWHESGMWTAGGIFFCLIWMDSLRKANVVFTARLGGVEIVLSEVYNGMCTISRIFEKAAETEETTKH